MKNSPKIHQVLVPLTSFYLLGSGFEPDEKGPVRITKSWDIPNTDIKLVRFSKRVGLSRESEMPIFDAAKVQDYFDRR